MLNKPHQINETIRPLRQNQNKLTIYKEFLTVRSCVPV